MPAPLTKEERYIRIMRNLKGNKPSPMVARFKHADRADEAAKRGETYVPEPEYTFLILEEGGMAEPITLQVIQDILGPAAKSRDGDLEPEFKPLKLGTARLRRSWGDETREYGEGGEVEGVKLRGSPRGWWNVLTKRLQPKDWPETMVFYVEHLLERVVCDGVDMHALKVRRHFTIAEVEEVREEVRESK